MWSHCQLPLFANRKDRYISVIVEPLWSHVFLCLCFRWRDEGASLVGHHVTWRALLFYPPIIAKAHHHYGLSWQQPLQESLHKQHCWVSFSKFLWACVIFDLDKSFLFLVRCCRASHCNCASLFPSDQSGVWGDAYERPEVSVTINRLPQQNQPGHRVYGITHWWRSIHSHTKSHEFLPCYFKVTNNFKHLAQNWLKKYIYFYCYCPKL